MDEADVETDNFELEGKWEMPPSAYYMDRLRSQSPVYYYRRRMRRSPSPIHFYRRKRLSRGEF